MPGDAGRMAFYILLGVLVPNISVDFPESVLASLNRIAEELGISLNRLIVELCRRVVEERTSCPEDPFSNDHLSEADLQLLRTSEAGFLEGINRARRSRKRLPF
ncbi:MAG: hypothetical protein OXN89_24425 [Bryobacterales bacterium]|nr:hypothetical protein [Bryobacterales bacterium]